MNGAPSWRGARYFPRAIGLVFALLGATACASLPDVTPGDCGNGVIDATEDCDTFAPAEHLVCRAAGTPGECHLDCRRQGDGTRPPCPAGWGCDRDGICRAPTGAFDDPADVVAVGAWSVLAGDFDGDGRADVLTRDRLDNIGQAKLRFQYFDENGNVEDSRLFPKGVLSPQVADISGDGRSDVVFTDTRLGVLLGRADRTWVPETFSSYRIAGTDVRLISVYNASIEQTSGFLSLAAIGDQAGFFIPDFTNGGMLRRLGAVPGSPADLAGDPVSGDLFEDPLTSPCLEVVYALRGANTFTVVDSCTRDPQSSEILWRSPLVERLIALDPPGAINGAPQLADMNGDGHLDVLLGVGGKPYVSYGDGQQLTPAVPYQVPIAGAPGVMDIPMPLAAGDVTGDGAVDFVFPTGLLLSARAAPGALPTYSVIRARLTPWTVAAIADLNGNGKPDVVAASNSALDIDFYNGTGSNQPTFFTVPTNGPVQMLTIGDFDGDSVNDLAFIETAASGKDRDALKISFGAPVRPPLGAVLVAPASGAEQLSVYTEGHLGNLGVVSREIVNGAMNSALTLLGGSGDRIPFAPYTLTTFSSDGSLSSSVAIALAPGAFTSERKGDVLALASEPLFAPPLRLWLLPAQDSPERRPLRFGEILDPLLSPVDSDPTGYYVHLASAVADLDRDGRDEAIFAMPYGDAQHCGILVASVTSEMPPALTLRTTITLDQPCQNPDLLAVDADADGWPDLELLTGTAGRDDRRIVVLWNDGRGGVASSDVGAVVGGARQVQAFTVLPRTSARPFSFAYVSGDAVMATAALPGSRQFAAAETLVALPNASGIVAADVTGDGAIDLVLAASGDLSILKAGLKSP